MLAADAVARDEAYRRVAEQSVTTQEQVADQQRRIADDPATLREAGRYCPVGQVDGVIRSHILGYGYPSTREAPVARKRPTNPLALAVLASLYERPMHPYEMASTLRSRGKDTSIKLNYGSLYTVVDTLDRRGLIEPQETQREGRRPERTVYGITDAGRIMLIDWLSEMVGTPVKEYTQFEAALALIGVLQPDDVVALLRERVGHLDLEIRQLRAVQELVVEREIPRLFTLEAEYWLTLREAELRWVSQLVDEIERGELASLNFWRELHRKMASGEQTGEEQTDMTSSP